MIRLGQFIDSPDPGGAETLVIEISRRVVPYGFTSEVLHFGNPWLEERCADLGIPCAEVPAYKYYRSIKTLPLFAVSFRRFLRERKVCLLHSHLLGSVTAGALATALPGIFHVGTLHDTYTIETRPSRFLLLRVASLLGTRLVTVSTHMHSYFTTLSWFPGPDMGKIFNGVDVTRFSREHARRRTELGIHAGETVLICVARLIEIKRHDILIKAFSLLQSSRPLRLLIVGDGPCRDVLEGLIRSYGPRHRVDLLGFRHDISDLLGLSDCFVLSSDSEGLSCSIAESMAAGIPAVVTDVGGNRELVVHGESGYVVPRRDPTALAACLQRLIDDTETRKLFGENARARAVQVFSIDETVRQYVELYRDVVAHPVG